MFRHDKPASLMNDAELAAGLGEGLDRALEIGPGVGRRHLGPDARLAARHHRERKADHIDARCSSRRAAMSWASWALAQHDRDDRMFARHQGEAEAFERRRGTGALSRSRWRSSPVCSSRSSTLSEVAAIDRRQRVGEEIGPRALAQPVDDLPARRGVAARGAAQGLAQGAGQDVDPALDAAVLRRAAAAVLAEKADGVAVVDHDQRRRSARPGRRSPAGWR